MQHQYHISNETIKVKMLKKEWIVMNIFTLPSTDTYKYEEE